MPDVKIRTVKEQDLNRCFEIESVAYAGDEAATKDNILKRIKTYPEGFIILENDREIIGFINSGATHEVEPARGFLLRAAVRIAHWRHGSRG